MSHWYVRSFNRDYLALYPHRDASEAREDVEAIIRLIAPKKGAPLLDLGCGAGRHLVALHKAGFRELTGLDLSSELLDIASKRLTGIGARDVKLVQADMRRIPFVGHFATVLSLFTSFGYFEHDEENAAVLSAVQVALRPGGCFLIDYLNRDWVIAHLTLAEERNAGGRHLCIERRLTTDRLRVEKTVHLVDASGKEKVYHESVRMYAPSDMEAMLRKAGFVEVRHYGSLRGEPHGPLSRKLVIVAKKEGKT